ncbi:MAG: hypothetical protein K2G44_01665 [Clostridia bacterium]|nr:hypothetical protein [Clostridia bacterium]
MNKTEIIEYIKKKQFAETADLQKKFGISYKEAKSIIAELVSNEDLVFSGGVRYDFVGRNKFLREERRAELERRREELIRRIQAETEEDEEDDDLDVETEHKIEDYLKYLEHQSEEDDGSEDTEYDNIINLMLHSDEDGDKITRRGQPPIAVDAIPVHSFWDDEEEFAQAVIERIECLVKSDMKMGRQGAVKKAEAYLEAVRDTNDRKKIQVYERLVYELKNTSSYLYGRLKKQFCEAW